ncbi:FAD-dependent urate hydroxylase [compost metagenome]
MLAETKDEQLIWNDIIDIKPLKHLALGNILFIGDAGHATTPNMGQGACQAIEDVAVLVDELKKTKDVTLAFKHFEQRRLKRTRYITETSWTIGKIAQWENPISIMARNTLMTILPEKIKQHQLKTLLGVDFMK